jgi:tellurite resistance protein TerC
MPLHSVGTFGLWAGFVVFVLCMIALDLGVLHRKARVVRVREAALWSLVWVAMAGIFAVFIWGWFGTERAIEFTTGYVLEKALAVDNIFVFVVVFAAFGVSPRHQHRVLLWGILGALVLRASFILAGAAFIQRFSWAEYVFGGILLFTGLKLFADRNKDDAPGEGRIVRFLNRRLPVASSPTPDGRFLTRQRGRLMMTPLLLALIAVELSDVVFALDSIPAIFAVTQDPFIVFTSNIFAILGLRAMYFLLAGIIERFHRLKTGLAFVLVFVGAKMLMARVYHVPIGVSLLVIAATIGGSVVWSVLRPKPALAETPAPELTDVPGPPPDEAAQASRPGAW